MRSPVTGLVGNTLHTDNQEWLRTDSGIGAGIDSFYEYLLKVGCTFCSTQGLSLIVGVNNALLQDGIHRCCIRQSKITCTAHIPGILAGKKHVPCKLASNLSL